jgi:hypothetical protein
MNSFNLIEILAETFNIYVPDAITLKAEAAKNTTELVNYLMQAKEGLKFQE